MMHVATLTIRNVPQRVVRRLKALAKRQNTSMEQVVRDLLEEHAGDRSAVLDDIEAAWQRQARRPGADEINAWIEDGRGETGSE
jgi:plasmid stability protein